MSKRKPWPVGPQTVRIEEHDGFGKGQGRLGERVVEVPASLPGELLTVELRRRSRRSANARIEVVVEPHPQRHEAPCSSFADCGGCTLQHRASEQQLESKQAHVLALMADNAVTPPVRVLDPISPVQWGYRRRGRLGVRFVEKKGGIVIGYREKFGNYITNLGSCPVMDPRLSVHLGALRTLIAALECATRIPQVEFAFGDEDGAVLVRHLEPLTSADEAVLGAFQRDTGIHVFSQSGGPDTVRAVVADTPSTLSYTLRHHGVRYEFGPLDFCQVNAKANELMVDQVIRWLDPRPGDEVFDLFCGLGNFSLPLAKQGAHVYGLEFDAPMIDRARQNAELNGLSPSLSFDTCDLSEPDALSGRWRPGANMLLDPPRSGAEMVVSAMPLPLPDKVAYVSCSPKTLARDAGILTARYGYRLAELGIVDMFPHTDHVETMALFLRESDRDGS